MTETQSRRKFVELAEKRVTRAIKAIRLVGNLSNRSNYTYTEEDVRKIVRALRTELKSLEDRFDRGNTDNEPSFRL